MPAGWAAAAAVGGALISSSASSKAAKKQAASANAANDLSREQFNQTRADTAGTRARGEAAGSQLQYLMGLGGGGDAGVSAQPQTREQLRASLLSQYTTPGTPASGGSSYPFAANGAYIGGGGDSAEASATWYNQNTFNPGTAGTAATIDEAGLNAAIDQQQAREGTQRSVQSQDPANGSLMRNFSAADRDADPLYAQMRPNIDAALQRSAKFETAPGYEFRKAEGAKSVENSAAAQGGLLSGAALKAMERYGQGVASNEYGNWFNQSNTDRNFVASQGDAAFNRFNGNNDRTYNRLAGISGTGQTATSQVNSLGAQAAAQQGYNTMAAGNAQAGATMFQGRQASNALTGIYNNYQDQQTMDRIQNPNGRNTMGNGVYSSGNNTGGWSGTSNQNFFYGNGSSGD